ncbi:speckle-type POZ protein-like [Phymastichus coffea]|uniref:speckle-type POZ protein-like n=1 Tax=Phymastichus coffea TaxID=108790 RepID=UPI00273BBE4C|nr:speckle-type POZ protein-like [Phymastichus coffea]
MASEFDECERFMQADNLPDVTFNMQGKKIKVNKSILSSQSPVFEAMFTHDMKEKQQNIVDIFDINYKIMKALFQFIYTENVRNLDSIVGDLLYAANKYQILKLKEKCESILFKQLTVGNAVEILNLTDICDARNLQPLVIHFIAINHREIVKMPTFSELNDNLKQEIYEIIAKRG